jgi:hypothetical protein
LIFSDYIEELDGGENLELDKWIFEDYSKLNLAYVLSELNKNGIDYCKSSNIHEVRLKTKNGVELNFNIEHENFKMDSNLLMLSSISLYDREEKN